MFILMLQLCFVTLSPEASTIERKQAQPVEGEAEPQTVAAGVWIL